MKIKVLQTITNNNNKNKVSLVWFKKDLKLDTQPPINLKILRNPLKKITS